jgi:iron complex outermembrane recepter protein
MFWCQGRRLARNKIRHAGAIKKRCDKTGEAMTVDRKSALRIKCSQMALLVAGALSVGTVFSGSAMAQTASAETPAMSAEVVIVTATKRGQTVEKAPLSVSVVSAATIEGTGATNFSELSTLVPSVVFSNSQTPFQSNIGMRGVATAGGSDALEPSVGIYVDGIFTDRTAGGIGDFNDIAAVEVLRGPQSTQFGNASPAGIINYVTRKPSAEFGGEVRGTFGDFNRQQIAGSITGTIIENQLLGRFSAFSHKRDGYIKNVSGADSNDQDSYGFRAKLLAGPEGPLQLSVSLEHSKSKQNCCAPLWDNVPEALYQRFATASTGFPFTGTGAPLPRDQMTTRTTAVNGPLSFEQVLTAGSFDFRYRFGDGFEFASISAGRQVDTIGRADVDFSSLDLIVFPNGLRSNRYVSQEFRLTSPSGKPLTYLVGAYYFSKKTTERNGSVINPQLAALGGGTIFAQNSPGGNDIHNQNTSVFGEATLAVSERLSLTAGLRYNYDDKSTTGFAERNRENGIPLSPRQTIPDNKTQRDGGEWTGKLIGQFQWMDNWNSYLSYTRGYKAFGINNDANLLRNIPGADYFFDSEVVDAYEFGTKGSIPSIRTSFALVFFDMKYDNFQSLSSFTDSNNQLRFFLQNAASVRSKGIELDFVSRPIDGLTITGALSLLDASFDSYPNAQGPTGRVDLTGRVLSDAPETSGSLVVRYERPIFSGLKAYVQADWFYRSDVFTELTYDPLQVQEAHSKYNARIGIGQQANGWSLEAWGRNLTDELTFGRATRASILAQLTSALPLVRGATFPVGNTTLKFVGDPRTYGATLIYRF